MSSRDGCGLIPVTNEGRTIKDVAVRSYCLRQDSFIALQICIEASNEVKTLPEQIFQVLGVLSRRCLPHHILASPKETAHKGNRSVCAGQRGPSLHGVSLMCDSKRVHRQICKASDNKPNRYSLPFFSHQGVQRPRQTTAYADSARQQAWAARAFSCPQRAPSLARIA